MGSGKMQNCRMRNIDGEWNRVRVRDRGKVMARAWRGVMVSLFCSSIAQISRNLMHSALHRCGMGMSLKLWLGSVARFRFRVRVSLRV